MDDSASANQSFHANDDHDDSSHGFAIIDSRKLEYSNELPSQPSDRSVVVEDTDETAEGQTILDSIDSNQGTIVPPASSGVLSVSPDELTLSDLADLTPPLVDEPTAVPSEIITEPDNCKPADESGNTKADEETGGLEQDSNAANHDPTIQDDSSTHVSLATKPPTVPSKRTHRVVACFVVMAVASSLVARHFVVPQQKKTAPDGDALDLGGGDPVIMDVSRVPTTATVDNGTDVEVSNTSTSFLLDALELEIDEATTEDDSERGLANESVVIDDSNKEEELFIDDYVNGTVADEPLATMRFDYGVEGELDPISYKGILVEEGDDEKPTTEGELHVKGRFVTNFVHALCVALVGIVASVCALGALQGVKHTAPKGNLTYEEICWIHEHCDDFLSRKGRRSSSTAEVDHSFDVSAYNCLTKEDLKILCDHFGVNITCISSRKKSWIVSKLVLRYEAILAEFTDLELAQLLGTKVVHFRRLARGELIKHVVEAGF